MEMATSVHMALEKLSLMFGIGGQVEWNGICVQARLGDLGRARKIKILFVLRREVGPCPAPPKKPVFKTVLREAETKF